MPDITFPTYYDVLNDSDLRPEQMSAIYGSLDAKTEVERKIVQQTAVVQNALVGKTALSEDEQGVATLTIEELTISAVYLKAGQLNAAYTKKSEEFYARAMRRLYGNPNDVRENGLVGPVDTGDKAASFAVVARRVDGYSRCGDEYSRCW